MASQVSFPSSSADDSWTDCAAGSRVASLALSKGSAPSFRSDSYWIRYLAEMSQGSTVAIDATPLLTGNLTGIGTYVHELIERLPGRINVLAFSMSFRGRNRLTELVRCRVSPKWRRVVPMEVAYPLWDAIGRPQARYWVGRKPSVIHGTNYVVPPLGNRRGVVTVHDLAELHLNDYSGQAGSFRRHLERAASEGAYFHAVSNVVATDLMTRLGVPEDRVRTIYHGVPALSSETSPPPGFDQHRPFVVAIGTYEPRKGFPDLVSAFDRIASQFPDVQLLIAGRQDLHSAEPDLTAQAKADSKNGDRIHLLDYVTPQQKAFMVRNAISLVVPSLYEGFCFPMLEAFVSETPVVARPVGGIPEVAAGSALLAQGDTVQDLAEAMEQVMVSESTRDALVIAGLERSRAFSWDTCVSEHMDLYQIAAS